MDQDRGQHSKAPGVPGNDSSGVGQRLHDKGERSGHTAGPLFCLYWDVFRHFSERYQYTACFAGKQCRKNAPSKRLKVRNIAQCSHCFSPYRFHEKHATIGAASQSAAGAAVCAPTHACREEILCFVRLHLFQTIAF